MVIAMQRFRYNPIFNGVYVLHCRLLKALVYTAWAGKKANLVWSIGKPLLNSPVFQNSYIYSVKVSLLGAILSIIVAYPIAMWLRKKLPAKVTIITILRAPMLVPGLVAASCSSI